MWIARSSARFPANGGTIRTSRRLDWQARPNALSLLLDEKRAAGAPILDLTVSNPTRVGIAYPAEAIARALGDPRAASYEPTPQGLPEARAAVADYYATCGLTVSPEDLILTASTSEAYSFLFKLLCDPGDVVLVPHPSYPLFEYLASLETVRLVPYPLGFDGHWFVDFDALQKAIDDSGGRARAILLVNPNNPTGSFLKREERWRLSELSAARNLPLIVDEVFADYGFDTPDRPRRVASLIDEERATCFSLSGLSKVVGLPQLKLGWIHVGGPRAERAALLGRLELVADTYLSVGAPVQLAARALLGMRDTVGAAIAARTKRNLAALQQIVTDTALQVLPVEGGWYATVRLPAIRTDEQWALELLRGDGVLVQPGYFYDFDGRAPHVVVSLLPEPAVFDDGAARMVARVALLSR